MAKVPSFTRTGGMIVMISAGMFLRPGLLVEQAQEAREVFSAPTSQEANAAPQESALIFPIAEYETRRTKKLFGQFVDDGRFLGYHTGEDVEYEDATVEVPVSAIADGTVRFSGWTPGYGGVIVVAHEIGMEKINALYGHLDIDSAKVKGGDAVEKGEFLANLGDHDSHETDGRRKHLHFGLYRGSELHFLGYVPAPEELTDWINPEEFFTTHFLYEKKQGSRL